MLGVPRRAAETPYEYRPRFTSRCAPVAATDVSDLTDAYVRVRYTPAPASDEDVQRAQAALDRIRASAGDVLPS